MESLIPKRSLAVLTACGVVLAGAPAFAAGQRVLDRQPCINPGAPPGCDNTISYGPKAGGPLPEEGLSPEKRAPTFRKPLGPAPVPAPPPPAPEGTVTVKPTAPADQPLPQSTPTP